jgi:hypothetical protein
MKKLTTFAAALPLIMGGCNLDTKPIDRYKIIEARDGQIIRLDTETGQVALVTKSGVEQLKDVKPFKLSTEEQAAWNKYPTEAADKASNPKNAVQKLKPGESTSEGLPPGVTVKRIN